MFESLLLFKRLIVSAVEIYKFHVLINRNKEKNTALELQCNNFKVTMK